MTAIAKLFATGHGQAVRIPKEFRFSGKEVRISRDGNKVVLEPIEESFDIEAWHRELDACFDDSFMAEGRQQPPMPDGAVSLDR